MPSRPVLLVELPVPAGREDEWNRWYREVHMPDTVARVAGVVSSARYRVVSGAENDIGYVVAHQFESVEALERFALSATLADRFDEYTEQWGVPPVFRRRALVPEFDLPTPLS